MKTRRVVETLGTSADAMVIEKTEKPIASRDGQESRGHVAA